MLWVLDRRSGKQSLVCRGSGVLCAKKPGVLKPGSSGLVMDY